MPGKRETTIIVLGPSARELRNVLIEIHGWDGSIPHYNEESIIEDLIEWVRALKEAIGDDPDLIMAEEYTHF